MIAVSRYAQPARRGDRLLALFLVALVHVGLGLALIGGLKVRLDPGADSPLSLVELSLPQPPPPPPPPPILQTPERSGSAAVKASPTPKGGVEAPSVVKQLAPVQPPPIIVLPLPDAPAAGGIAGRGGPSTGAGAGGGQGGEGSGSGAGGGEGDGGGTELEQIAGSIRPSDYPRQLRNRGIGGLVEMRFTVATNGRVSRCVVTSSSGVGELDELTCRLIQQRFVFRPSTDRSGRAIASDVEGDHLWEARRDRE